MRRVLHVGKFYPPVAGGMERVVASLCRATAGRVDNSVIALNDARATVRETVEGIPVVRLGTIGRAGSVPIAPGLVGELRRSDADLLVVHEPNPWALLALAVVRPPMPLAVWFHSEVVRPPLQYALFYHPLVRAVYDRARRIFVSSGALAAHARALAPYRDRIAIVPFGIDADAWAAPPAPTRRAAEVRQEADGRALVLFAGRMVPYKGVDVLLEAIAPIHDVQLVLAGDGPCRPRWEALAGQLGLGQRVRFLGDVPAPELVSLFHACDVFVLPSITAAEAFGFVQLEAMACGKPVVSTRVLSGVPWVNRDGETGCTVPPGDPVALRQAIARLIADRELRAAMGRAGRARVAAEFTLEKMAAAAVAEYDAIVAASAA